MDASDELLTIAELAVGLAGFSGIVIAFSQRGGLREADKFYFIALLASAGTAALLAFVPFLLYHTGFDGATLWAYSSIIMLLVWVAMIISLVGTAIRMGDFWGNHPLGFGATAVVGGLPIVNFPLQVGNIMSIPLPSGPAIYLAGLIMWLVCSLMMFVHLVLVGSQE